MLRKSLLWIFGVFTTLVLCFAMYLIFVVKIGPVNLSKTDSIEITGIVDNLYEGGVKDLVFKLEDNSHIYYINRALDKGFDLEHLKRELQGEEITFWHAKSRASAGGHIIQLQYKDSVYYTEWQIPLK